MPDDGLTGEMTYLNPIHTFVDGLRTLLVKGYLPDWQVMAWTAGSGIILFLVSIVMFYRAELHLRATG